MKFSKRDLFPLVDFNTLNDQITEGIVLDFLIWVYLNNLNMNRHKLVHRTSYASIKVYFSENFFFFVHFINKNDLLSS